MIGTEPTLGLGPANQATLFVILSPVGSYFGASKAVTLLCDPRYVRWPRQHGKWTNLIYACFQGDSWWLRSHQDGIKLRSNTLGSESTTYIIIPITQKICETTNFQEAEKAGCQQVLWVFGRDQEITEVGAMNIFVLLR